MRKSRARRQHVVIEEEGFAALIVDDKPEGEGSGGEGQPLPDPGQLA